MTEKIMITGRDGKTHEVNADVIDRFFSGKTGKPLTDEEWDEQKRRIIEAEGTF